MVSYATPAGTITLDGNIDDWHEVSWLRPHKNFDPNDQFGANNLPLYATTSDTHFVFALNASQMMYGWESWRPKLWFDADLDASTGSKFYGVYGGVNVQVPRPYQMAEGIDFEVRFVDRVPQLFTGDGAPVSADIQYSESANVIEFSVERSAFGASTEAMRVQLPLYDGNYGGYHFTPPSMYFGASGDIALDGSSGDWTAADRLDSPANGVDGFAVWGKATENAFVFAIQSPIGIGNNSTIWLNTDDDASTGYQIWGWAGGAEYNINFDATSTPRLYGIDQVSDLGFAFSQDRKFVELIVPKELIDSPAQVNALLDINDLTFLPTLYAETQYEIVDSFSDFMLA